MKRPQLTEREETRIVREKSLDYEPNPKGLGYELYYSMRQNANAIAQIDAETGETDSYGNLLQRCIRTSLKLLMCGVTGDDVLCQCCSNDLNSCVPIISSLFLGIRMVPLDPSLALETTLHILNLVKPKIIFVSSDTVEYIAHALDKSDLNSDLVVFGESEKYLEFKEFLKSAGDEQVMESRFRPLPILNIRQAALVLFSSGFSEFPKGICLSHHSLMIQTVNTIVGCNFGKHIHLSNFGKERGEGGHAAVLSFRTYFWISAVLVLSASVLTGSTRIICSKFDATAAWHLIEKYKVTCLTCHSYEAEQLYRAGKPEGVEGKSLKLLLTISRPLSKMSLMELRKLVPYCFITNTYSQTKACGAVTMYSVMKPGDIMGQYENPTSCGKLVPGVSCKIVDPHTNKILGPMQAGELIYKASFTMSEYFNPDSSPALDRDGWFRTGDLAYYDEGRRFYVMDRLEELFKYRQWYIVPVVIEDVIKEHKAVKNAVVMGIPHEDPNIGEVPMGFVTLKKGMRNRVTAEDIEEFVNKHVSDRLKLRGGARIIKDIPVTHSGKPKRLELKETLLEEVFEYCLNGL